VSEQSASREDRPAPRAIPLFFGPPERSLFGLYHAPPGPSTRRVAVVLCNPLGYEAMSVHRTYRHLAERLAARGFPTLRFDYDGTGNSAGCADDPGRIRAWVGSVKAAIVRARAGARVRRVALFGVRFGATLATVTAAEDGDIDAVIAWSPVVSGAAYVRELRGSRLLKYPRAPAPSDGSEEVGGHVFAAETLADMAMIDLRILKQGLPKRALVIPRTERSKDEPQLANHLNAQGTVADVRALAGYAGMMRDDPYDTIVPFETLDAVVEWLSAAHPDEVAGMAPSPLLASVVTASRSGRATVKETALRFGEGSRLFGVFTEADGLPAQPDRPTVCFLNVGANHHVGPHRMNVDLSRELALNGYTAFRMDVAGLGDSAAAPGVRENRIYTKDAIVDVKSAMDLLGGLRGAKRFVLVGLCSGAYLAHHTSAQDHRVVGQVQISPFAFEWQEGDSVAPTTRKPFRSTRFYLQSLLDREAWLRTLRGDVGVRAIAGVLRERLWTRVDNALPSTKGLLPGRRRPRNAVERTFGEVCDRGVETLIVLSVDDGAVDMIAGYLGTDARRMRGCKNFSCHLVEGADHTFTTATSHRVLRELLTSYLATRFA
jgi:alpha-beta hydrolase superfamily lysophospholipase